MATSDMRSKTLLAYCLACRSSIRFSERPELYDYVSCPECDEGFEIIGLTPIQLDWPSEFGDDDLWLDAD